MDLKFPSRPSRTEPLSRADAQPSRSAVERTATRSPVTPPASGTSGFDSAAASDQSRLDLAAKLSARKTPYPTAMRVSVESTASGGKADVSLNVVVSGKVGGPPIVFLHGFPENSGSWAKVTGGLSSDFTTLAPDQRGYNTSDKPTYPHAYVIDRLVEDARTVILAANQGGQKAILVAHDWGGVVAYVLAHRHPELVKGLVVMNAPHPDVYREQLANNPAQQKAAFYVKVLKSPLANWLLSRNNYDALIDGFEGALSRDEAATYRKAYAQPGALTGMIAWYRQNLESGLLGKVRLTDNPALKNVSIEVPTLVLWGMKDTAVLAPNREVGPHIKNKNFKSIALADTGHWVPETEPAAVAKAIATFARELE